VERSYLREQIFSFKLFRRIALPSLAIPLVIGERTFQKIKPSLPTIDQAIERLYALRVGTKPVEEGSPHEKPHKPLLLLAALDLIDERKATRS
jgi:hypothetical protein